MIEFIICLKYTLVSIFFFSTKVFELLHAALKDEESGELYLLLLSPYSTKDQNQQMLIVQMWRIVFFGVFLLLLMKIEIMLECYSKLMLVGHFLGFLNSI